MLDIKDLTHTSDLWEYYYQGNSDKLDSVVRYLTIEGFQPSRRVERYSYFGDSVIVKYFSVSLATGDTLNNWINIYKDNFRENIATDLQSNCIYHSKFDERGIKLLDVSKCPRDTGFTGQVFYLYKTDDYIEKYEEYLGKIDSNSIWHYYLNEFDSIVADFMVEKGKGREPYIVYLNIYNNRIKKKKISYSFELYPNINQVSDFEYYTYNNKNQLYRIYSFYLKSSRGSKEREYELANYTEYEYDKMGRKIRATTRVKPDPKKPEEKR